MIDEIVERRNCCIDLDKRLTQLEWSHKILEDFSKQMHTDQMGLKTELNKIADTLSQIKWMVVGIVVAYLVTKGDIGQLLFFLP